MVLCLRVYANCLYPVINFKSLDKFAKDVIPKEKYTKDWGLCEPPYFVNEYAFSI